MPHTINKPYPVNLSGFSMTQSLLGNKCRFRISSNLSML